MVKVIRRGPRAVHYVVPTAGKGEEACPLQTGSEVDMNVDWSRRFDHMQQHSGEWARTTRKYYLHCSICRSALDNSHC